MLNLFRQLTSRSISIKQAVLAVLHFLSPSRRRSGDDFHWASYHSHYAEELKSISRAATLILKDKDIALRENKLHISVEPGILPSHHALYETLILLRPRSVLEVGCGGGDHLTNLKTIFQTQLQSELRLAGVDRSEKQLDFLRARHGDLDVSLSVSDVTDVASSLEAADIVYSHAVLMHISESEGRLVNALTKMIRSASQAVVLMENWTQHDFLLACKEALRCSEKENWGAYFHTSSAFPEAQSLILSPRKLDMEVLANYSALLGKHALRPH
jgi:trans-aconitate methyltransferase